jgi:tRNA 2-thiouridine synthesizing protein A
MSPVEIDARGRACPEPAVMTKNAAHDNPEGFTVLVDNICAVENLSRFAANFGYALAKSQEGPDYRLVFTKK